MRGGMLIRDSLVGALSFGWGLYLAAPLVAVALAAAAFAVIVEATIR
jgi:hypothetical protein